jgi:Arc/MetJ-type ribon-helix-helix transcriptional regulator
MRTTKNLTISLPPAMLREMEQTAKREHRTLSELVRENFRRSQQQPDLYELLRQIAPTPRAFQALYEDAKRKGTDKLSMAEINREVAAVRRKQNKKKGKPAGR